MCAHSVLRSHDEQFLFQLVYRRQPASDRRLPIHILAVIERVPALIRYHLSVHANFSHQSRMRPAHDEEIRPAEVDLLELRFDIVVPAILLYICVIRSDGKTAASSSVTIDTARQLSIS